VTLAICILLSELNAWLIVCCFAVKHKLMNHMRRKVFYRIFLFVALVVSGFVCATGGLTAGAYAALEVCTERGWSRGASILLTLGAPASPKNSMIDWYYLSFLGDTPLHTAVKREDLALVDILLQGGAIVDWCCCSCVTPLHDAILSKNKAIVTRLLQAGANTSIQYNLELGALELAQTRSTREIADLVASHNSLARRHCPHVE
jgi:hypothetical protein